jgi:TetR/AcrR family transcriptional regulator, fatty acid biosynthesis regulator
MVLRATLEKKEEKERVRAALLRAALRLAAAHGFASLGLREVAREAGIAPTSFYRHFADMEELGMALIRELVGGVRRELGTRVLAAPRAETVPALVDAALAATASDPELWRFLVAERPGASAGFRALLRVELAALAHTLHTASQAETTDPATAPPRAADAAVGLLFDACGRALDEPVARHALLREPLIWAMQTLLSAPPASRSSDG